MEMTQGKALRSPPRPGRSRRAPGTRQPRTTALGTTPYSYPQDLIDAQDELDQIHRALTELCNKLPWSADPGGAQEPRENALRPPPRLSSEGWDSDDAAELARLRARAAELVGKIVAHRFWHVLDPADVPASWDALQQHQQPADRSS